MWSTCTGCSVTQLCKVNLDEYILLCKKRHFSVVGTENPTTGRPVSGLVRVQPGKLFNKNNKNVRGEGFESLTSLHES
jgi:hypothetical protein